MGTEEIFIWNRQTVMASRKRKDKICTLRILPVILVIYIYIGSIIMLTFCLENYILIAFEDIIFLAAKNQILAYNLKMSVENGKGFCFSAKVLF